MIAFIVKRFFWLLVTMWAVFTVSFILMRSVPGGPFDGDRQVAPEIKRNMERRYNLDKELHEQYFIELRRTFLEGDLGYCMKLTDRSVNYVIAQGLPVSAALGVLALAFAMTFGLLTGVVSAARRGSVLDVGLRLVATIGIALPSFVVASICIMLFVFMIPLFPAAGWGSASQLVLPAFCLGAPYAAEVARISRTSLLDALSQDYIRTARAKGLAPLRVIVVHALRNALIPVITVIGLQVGSLLAGAVLTETIFSWPGIGKWLIDSIARRDYPVVQTGILVSASIFVFVNLIVDLLYGWANPRIRAER